MRSWVFVFLLSLVMFGFASDLNMAKVSVPSIDFTSVFNSTQQELIEDMYKLSMNETNVDEVLDKYLVVLYSTSSFFLNDSINADFDYHIPASEPTYYSNAMEVNNELRLADFHFQEARTKYFIAVSELGGMIVITEFTAGSTLPVDTLLAIDILKNLIEFYSNIVQYFYHVHTATQITVDSYNTLVDDLNGEYDLLMSMGLDEYDGKHTVEIESSISHALNLSSDYEEEFPSKIVPYLSLKKEDLDEAALTSGSSLLTKALTLSFIEIQFMRGFWDGSDSRMANYLKVKSSLRDSRYTLLEEESQLVDEYTSRKSAVQTLCSKAEDKYGKIPMDVYSFYSVDYDLYPSLSISEGFSMIDRAKETVDDSSVGIHITTLYQALLKLDIAEQKCQYAVEEGNSLLETVETETNELYSSVKSQLLNLDPETQSKFQSRLISISSKMGKGSSIYDKLNSYLTAYQSLKSLSRSISIISSSEESSHNSEELSNCLSEVQDLLSSAETDGLDLSDYRPLYNDLINNGGHSVDYDLSRCEELKSSLTSNINTYYDSYSAITRSIVLKLKSYPELQSNKDYKALMKYLDYSGNILLPKSVGHLSEIMAYVSSLNESVSITDRSNFINSLRLRVSKQSFPPKSLTHPYSEDLVTLDIYSLIIPPKLNAPTSVKLPLSIDLTDYSLYSSTCQEITPLISKGYLSLSFTDFPTKGCTFKFIRNSTKFEVRSHSYIYLNPSSFKEVYSLKVYAPVELTIIPRYNYPHSAELNGNSIILGNPLSLSKGMNTLSIIYDYPGLYSESALIKNDTSYSLEINITNEFPVSASEYVIYEDIPKTDVKKPFIDVDGCSVKSYNVINKEGSNFVEIKISEIPAESKCSISLLANYKLDRVSIVKMISNLSRYEYIDEVKLHLDNARAYLDLDLIKSYNEILKANTEVRKYINAKEAASKYDGQFTFYNSTYLRIKSMGLTNELFRFYSSFESAVSDYNSCEPLDLNCKSRKLSQIIKSYNNLYTQSKLLTDKYEVAYAELERNHAYYSKYVDCDSLPEYSNLNFSADLPDLLHHIILLKDRLDTGNSILSQCKSSFDDLTKDVDSKYSFSLSQLKDKLSAYEKACMPSACNEDLIKGSKSLLSQGKPSSPEDSLVVISEMNNYIDSLDSAVQSLKSSANEKLVECRDYLQEIRNNNPPNMDVYEKQLRDVESLYSNGYYAKALLMSTKFLSNVSANKSDNRIFLAALGLAILAIVIFRIYQESGIKKKVGL